MNGTRNVPLSWAFQPQIFNCKFCQDQHREDGYVARLENPKDIKRLYERVGAKHPFSPVDVWNTRYS